MSLGWNQAEELIAVSLYKHRELMDHSPVCLILLVERVCHLIFIYKGSYKLSIVDQMDGMWRLVGLALELGVGLVWCKESLEYK